MCLRGTRAEHTESFDLFSVFSTGTVLYCGYLYFV